MIQPESRDRAQDIVLHPQNEVMVQVWTEARQFSEALAGHSHADGFNVLACELGCATLVRPGGSHERGPVVPAPPWLALWRAWHRTPDPNRGPRLILSASIAGHFWPR